MLITAEFSAVVVMISPPVCVNLFYAKFRNLTCTAYLEMF